MKVLLSFITFAHGLAATTAGPQGARPERPDEAFAVYLISNLEDTADGKHKSARQNSLAVVQALS